jgi:hypothetical protein
MLRGFFSIYFSRRILMDHILPQGDSIRFSGADSRVAMHQIPFIPFSLANNQAWSHLLQFFKILAQLFSCFCHDVLMRDFIFGNFFRIF